MTHLDILAIGAHPDDVELSCGGTVAKCVKLGYKVGIADLTRGETGTRGTARIRAKEAIDAAKILGVTVRENLNLPDGRFDVNEKNRLKVIELYRKYRPKIILIPHWHERHPDHVHSHQLCREAWFYSGLAKIKTKLNGKYQQSWRPNNFFHFMQKYEFEPSFIVDITDVYELRVAAIKSHKSQFYNPDSSEPETFLSQKSFLDFMETRMRYYGSKIGVKYGEPFYSVETIGIKDLSYLVMFKG
ncbi:MAG: bacillithiol biosynthesis deacetylase BshB1 [Ignavibacteriae bacterium]|nr:bacillithiol biosynthesis deacetylase BshB1 [Ignavibacteriota bacterium]